jgi:hypothetical protein
VVEAESLTCNPHLPRLFRANQGPRQVTITAAHPDQSEFSETGSAAYQEASGTDQNEFGEFAYAAA